MATESVHTRQIDDCETSVEFQTLAERLKASCEDVVAVCMQIARATFSAACCGRVVYNAGKAHGQESSNCV
eukprot:3939705-Pleurochrysis_carterae.AAC.2